MWWWYIEYLPPLYAWNCVGNNTKYGPAVTVTSRLHGQWFMSMINSDVSKFPILEGWILWHLELGQDLEYEATEQQYISCSPLT